MEKLKAQLTESEKKIFAKIKRQLGKDYKPYDFWFIYDSLKAVNWEGGTELGQSNHFRNQYTIEQGKPLRKNWEG